MDYKEEKDLVDYDDLLTKTLELLQIDHLREYISDAYKYIMVDEYQDSNTLQEKIVFLLAQKRAGILGHSMTEMKATGDNSLPYVYKNNRLFVAFLLLLCSYCMYEKR